MQFHVLSIFPELFLPFFQTGIIGRACANKAFLYELMDIRAFSDDPHSCVDDRPYGGGCGMVMKPEPIADAIRTIKKCAPDAYTVFLSPQGRRFSQGIAEDLSRKKNLILLCGRYEGVDERVCCRYVDDEISIGDYVLSGGEVAAMVVMDAVIRLLPGVLGGEDSAQMDSFSKHLLEHPHYTRPPVFEGETVPDVLLSGNHREIDTWRKEHSLLRTLIRRKDLFLEKPLPEEDLRFLKNLRTDLGKILENQAVYCTDALSGVE